MKKQQIVIIHGGDTFKTYKKYFLYLTKQKIDFERHKSEKSDWKKTLRKALGRNFEVIAPKMPNNRNAKYAEWEVWFKKFIPYFKSEIILIGHSLGGLFLVKFLAENKFQKKIRAIFLVAPPYGKGDFLLSKEDLERFNNLRARIFIYHSKDDAVVPFSNFEKYQKCLKGIIAKIFFKKGHFNQSKFPELVKDIKNILK